MYGIIFKKILLGLNGWSVWEFLVQCSVFANAALPGTHKMVQNVTGFEGFLSGSEGNFALRTLPNLVTGTPLLANL